ncbi:MAG TPA: hypothetical protein VFB12_17165 [Ktedonobacteraceae bacterium]|nr:hypothetical protein [Ktedonobacteraceae bacterium]
MDKTVILLAKAVALAGGAALGALLARWCDEWIFTHVQEKSEYDKSRYAQGLAPIAPTPPTKER